MEIEKREGKGEKADMYCGCLMTAKEEERKKTEKHRDGDKRRVLRQNERTLGEEKCERKDTSKKPIAVGTERGSDPVHPPPPIPSSMGK